MPNFKKNIIPHEKFYISEFTKDKSAPYLVFIHGGPGYNSGYIEYYIEHEKLFESLEINIVLYDQRNCGRSVNFFKNTTSVSHTDNINDLKEIYQYLTESAGLQIKAFIGHSYGAKLLFDFYKKSNIKIPGIFISTADSILTPRVNNLNADLAYMKKIDPLRYHETLVKMENLDLKVIWNLTEELGPSFQTNKDRHYLYWANLTSYEKTLEIQKIVNLPANQEVFMSVRKDLYSNEENFSVAVDSLDDSHLWINGFQDYIMGEPANGLSKKSSVTLFSQSAHYPHIEESKHFCETVNAFIKKI